MNATAQSISKQANIKWTRAMHDDGYIFTLRGPDKTNADHYGITSASTGPSDDTELIIKHVLNG